MAFSPSVGTSARAQALSDFVLPAARNSDQPVDAIELVLYAFCSTTGAFRPNLTINSVCAGSANCATTAEKESRLFRTAVDGQPLMPAGSWSRRQGVTRAHANLILILPRVAYLDPFGNGNIGRASEALLGCVSGTVECVVELLSVLCATIPKQVRSPTYCAR